MEPGVPMKLTLSDTLLERKLLLLNSTKKQPQGKGFMIKDWPVIPVTEYQGRLGTCGSCCTPESRRWNCAA